MAPISTGTLAVEWALGPDLSGNYNQISLRSYKRRALYMNTAFHFKRLMSRRRGCKKGRRDARNGRFVFLTTKERKKSKERNDSLRLRRKLGQ